MSAGTLVSFSVPERTVRMAAAGEAAPDATGQLGDQLRDSGIGLDDLTKTLAPMWDTFWPVLKFVVMLGVPALIVAAIGWLFFVRWSQHGVSGL